MMTGALASSLGCEAAQAEFFFFLNSKWGAHNKREIRFFPLHPMCCVLHFNVPCSHPKSTPSYTFTTDGEASR